MAYIGNSPANTGNYQLVDDIASGFNGSLVSFALASGGTAITPAKSGQILANINGVMQEPDDGGTNGFKVVSSNIVFSSAPASGDTFWAVYQGQNVDIGTPSDDVVDTAHIKDDAVTADKLANSINTEIAANTAKTGITSGQASAITANTAKTGITSSQATAITAALPKAGGTMTGKLIINGTNTASVTNAATLVASQVLSVNSNSGEGSDNLMLGAMSDGTGDQFIEATNSSGTAEYKLHLNQINNGTVVLGGGLAIGGTGAANTLDDYEEGTWTPVSPTGSISSTKYGRYTKVGNLVTVWCQAYSIVTDGSSASLYITGFPFASSSTQGRAMGSLMTSGMDFQSTSGTGLCVYVGDGGTGVQVYQSIKVGTWKPVLNSYVSSADQIMFTVSYRTDS